VGRAIFAVKKAGEMPYVAAVQLVLFAQAQQLLLVLHRAKRARYLEQCTRCHGGATHQSAPGCSVEIRLPSWLQPSSAEWLGFASDGQCGRWSSERQKADVHTSNRSDARSEYIGSF
jgi:hypothetical protein